MLSAEGWLDYNKINAVCDCVGERSGSLERVGFQESVS